jgi:glucose-1-phosphate adenylyltransferase
VDRSILSPNVRINSFAHISESVLMDNVEVGRRCRIRRAIIDKFCRILPDTVIGWDPEKDRRRFTVTEGGVVVIPSAMVVGPNEDEAIWTDPVVRFSGGG